MFWKINSQENWREFERHVTLFIYMIMYQLNIYIKYDHDKMNKKFINRRNDITQG